MMMPRIDPEEEARHREAMAGLGLGLYGAVWALAKEVTQSDVCPAQRRLLLPERVMRGGPILKLFPEQSELGDDGYSSRTPVTILNADGVDVVADIRYLLSNRAYRIIGRGWTRFVKESGISRGDRIDVYTCMRDDGLDDERCLFFFKS